MVSESNSATIVTSPGQTTSLARVPGERCIRIAEACSHSNGSSQDQHDSNDDETSPPRQQGIGHNARDVEPSEPFWNPENQMGVRSRDLQIGILLRFTRRFLCQVRVFQNPKGLGRVPTIPNDGIIGWIIFRLCLPVSSADIRCFISFFYYFSLVFSCRYITTYIHTYKIPLVRSFEENRKGKITSKLPFFHHNA